MDILKKRKAQKREHKAFTDGDTLGRLALWYGRGKVTFRGQLTIFGEDSEDDSLNNKYTVILLEPNRPSKYILNGFITIPNPQNAYPNRRQDKRKFEPETRIGSIYLYESAKGDGYYAMIYFDEEVNTGHGSSYIAGLEESRSDNPKAPVMVGDVRFLTPKEPAYAKDKQNKRRKQVQGTEGVKTNPYFKRVVASDFEKSRIDVVLELIGELSSDEVKQLADKMLEIKERDTASVQDYEIVETSDDDDDDDDDLPWDYEDEEEEAPNEMPSIKVPRIKNVVNQKSADMSNVFKRVSESMTSDLVEGVDSEDII